MTSLDPSHLPSGHLNKHQARGQDVYNHQRLPGNRSFPIPDLRFEQSYLRSLRRFINDNTPGHSNVDSVAKPSESTRKGDREINATGMESRVEAAAPGLYGIPVQIDWGGVLWVTCRDQVFSPLAQGAIWGIALLLLRPLLGNLGAWIRIHFRQSWHSIYPTVEPHVQGGTGWMRKRLREFNIGGIGTNVALAK